MDNYLVGSLQLESGNEIRIQVTEFKGEIRLDIRKYIDTEKYTGYTKQGISIPAEHIKALKLFIQYAIEYIEENGLAELPDPEEKKRGGKKLRKREYTKGA